MKQPFNNQTVILGVCSLLLGLVQMANGQPLHNGNDHIYDAADKRASAY
ncbi:MAG: hypothetical protein ABIX01_07815 [Chitinophagaceae bacterium]